jgi:ADP-heptose:LPS heptosyltransferase
LKTIEIRRHGSLGDVVIALCIAKHLAQHNYRVTFSTTYKLLQFVEYQYYISNVTYEHTSAAIDLNEVEWLTEFNGNRQKIATTDYGTDIFIRYVNSKLNNELVIDRNNLSYDISYPSAYKRSVYNHLRHFPKPWIILNTTATVSNRSIPINIAQNIQDEYNGTGTVFWLGMNSKLKKNNLIDIFGTDLFYFIAILDCSDIVVTTNTSSLQFSAAFNKKTVSIEQSWKTSEWLYNNNSNIINVNSQLSCLYCNRHGGCDIDAYIDNTKFPMCSNISVEKVIDAINRLS